MKQWMIKSFSENISKLRLRRNVRERYQMGLIFVTNKITVHFNVFGTLVIARIGRITT